MPLALAPHSMSRNCSPVRNACRKSPNGQPAESVRPCEMQRVLSQSCLAESVRTVERPQFIPRHQSRTPSP
eukprot:scaffold50025_cov91-Phaeocystis_antarctica.AAC.2